jgi:hypothetical protein
MSGSAGETPPNTSATLTDFTIAAGTTYTGDDGSSTVLADAVINDGTLALVPVTSQTNLTANGTVTLNGTGVVLLGTAALSFVGNDDGLTLGAGQTVLGGGEIYLAINAGTIDADTATPLVLQQVTNTGTLLANAGGTLEVAGATPNSGLIEADGGTILVSGQITQTGTGLTEVLAGSTLLLAAYGAQISGGTLQAAAGAVLGTSIDTTGVLSDVTLVAGTTFTGEDGSGTGLLGTITNDGTLALAPTATGANFAADGTLVIDGTGLILLGDSAPSYFYGSGETTIDAGQTIEGAGQVDGVLSYGTIIADGSIAGSAPLTVSNSTNEGTLLAVNGGTLVVSGGGTNDGLIEETASTLLGHDTIDQSSTGLIELIGGTGDIDNFSGGTILVTAGATLTLGGGTNSGLIEADGGTILVTGQITQTGTGQIELLSGSSLLLDNYGATITGGTLSAAAGDLLGNTANYGILADVTLAAGTTFTALDGSNTGLLGTITNDGTLAVAATADDTQFGAAGTVLVDGTGLILLGAAGPSYFSGGGEATIGAGQTVEGGGDLDSVVNDGTVLATLSTPLTVSNSTNAGTLLASNGGTLIVNGGTNDGLIAETASTLLGYNTIDQSASGLIELTGGTGDIGYFSGGTILVTGGATLTLAGTDSGLVEADGGTILIAGTLAQTGTGQIDVLAGATLLLDAYSATIAGGTLSVAAAGAAGNAAGMYGILDGVTLAAGTEFTGQDGSNTVLLGTVVNDGTLSLAPTGDYTQFSAGGTLLVGGTGLILLGATAESHFNGGGGTTTIGAGQTIEGGGQVDTVINDGTILATLATPLTVSNSTNAGTLLAANGGTLVVDSGTNDGLIEENASTLLGYNTIDQSASGLIELIGGTGDIGSFSGGTILVTSGATLTLAGTNSGLVEAEDGTILIAGTLTQTGTGAIDVLAGSTLLLGQYSATILGGTLSVAAGGVGGNAANTYGILDDVTLAAGTDFTGQDGSNTVLLGTIVNDGTLSLAPSGDYTQFSAGGTLLVGGTGLILLGATAESHFNGGGGTTTIGSGQTIEGGGQVDTVINDGTILATLATPLTVSNSTNAGTLLAGNGGTLVVSGGTNDGLVEENGGSLLVTGTLDQSAGGVIELIGGTGEIQNFSAGTILVTSGATLSLDNGTNSGLIEADGGTILVSQTIEQTGTGAIDVLAGSTLLLDYYNSAITGGTLTAAPGAVLGTAPSRAALLTDLTLSSGSTYTGEDASQTFVAGTITNDGTLALASPQNQARLEASGPVTLDGTGVISLGTSGLSQVFGNDEMVFGAGQTFEGAGGVDSVTNDGTGIADLATPLVVGNGTNNGLLLATSGGTLSLDGVNVGRIAADGGSVVTFGTVLADGTLAISNGGSLVLNAGIDPLQTVDFGGDGTGTLLLQQPGTGFASPIIGLAGGDRIEVTQIQSGYSITAASVLTPGTITVTGNFPTYQLTDVGFSPGASENFTVGQDSATGLNFIEVAACYLRGTLIATPRGERPIEAFRIGDLVLTASGAARAVRWIGRRSYVSRFARRNPAVMPVLIRAGALADGVPRRDLFVSPQHAMWLDGMLIEAAALRNGVSVLTAEIGGPIEYVHLELDTHDVLLAEGAHSESFVDDDSRMMFSNAVEFFELYGDTSPVPARFCAPRVSEGAAVEAARRRIAARAGLASGRAAMGLRGAVERVEAGLVAGWAENPDCPAAPVCLDVLVEGVVVARTLANLARVDPACVGGGKCGFVARPAWPLTLREVGLVEVRRSLDGAVLARNLAGVLAA